MQRIKKRIHASNVVGRNAVDGGPSRELDQVVVLRRNSAIEVVRIYSTVVLGDDGGPQSDCSLIVNSASAAGGGDVAVREIARDRAEKDVDGSPSAWRIKDTAATAKGAVVAHRAIRHRQHTAVAPYPATVPIIVAPAALRGRLVAANRAPVYRHSAAGIDDASANGAISSTIRSDTAVIQRRAPIGPHTAAISIRHIGANDCVV